MQYGAVRKFSKQGKCSNVPLECSIEGCHGTIWKYSAILHLWVMHHDNDNKLPKIPWDFWLDIFINRAEEQALGIPDDHTNAYRSRYGVPETDEMLQRPESGFVAGITRRRGDTFSSVLSNGSLELSTSKKKIRFDGENVE
jgi:hypothetical protein